MKPFILPKLSYGSLEGAQILSVLQDDDVTLGDSNPYSYANHANARRLSHSPRDPSISFLRAGAL